jgi:hypothetical protein
VRGGSIFHRPHVPIHKWLLGFRLMAGPKKGFSAHKLHRTLAGGEGMVIEAEETYVAPPSPGSRDRVSWMMLAGSRRTGQKDEGSQGGGASR